MVSTQELMEFIARLAELREPEDRVVEIRLTSTEGRERRFKVRITNRYPPSLAPPAAGKPHVVFTIPSVRFSELVGGHSGEEWRQSWERGEIAVAGDRRLAERIVAELSSAQTPAG